MLYIPLHLCFRTSGMSCGSFCSFPVIGTERKSKRKSQKSQCSRNWMPNTHKTIIASRCRRTGYRYFLFWIILKVPIYSSICLTRFWNFPMLHPLLHKVSQTQMLLSTHGILNQGLIPRDGTTKLWMEKLQDLFKTKLPMLPLLALCSLGDWISETTQTLWQIQTHHTWLLCIQILALCRQVIICKCWTRRDLHDKTKGECCANTEVRIWVHDFCAVTECCNRVEESMGRTKWQTTRGQAAHQHETELDTKEKRHVNTEANQSARKGRRGYTEAEHCIALQRFVESEKWQCRWGNVLFVGRKWSLGPFAWYVVFCFLIEFRIAVSNIKLQSTKWFFFKWEN